MRFNNKELANIALYGTGFDKEGVLLIKEKQEGLFKRGEAYVERWCKLKGNLLFYFKTKDRQSEPMGLIVLERCTVELDMREEMPYSFELVFDGDDRIQYMSASSEHERDLWIEALHIASFECMQMQLQNLREQINARTGRDPLTNPEPTCVEDDSDDQENDEPSLEMCFRCDGLPPNADDSEPDTFVAVYVATPPSHKWVHLTKTEVIDKNCSPSFSKTVSFTMFGSSSVKTKVKLVVNNVRERLTNTTYQIGTVMFSVMDLISADNNRLRLTITNNEQLSVGHVIIMAWGDDIQGDLAAASRPNSKNSPAPQRSPRKREKTKRRDMLRPLYNNIMAKSFRFPATDGTEISVSEYLGESKLCFYLPQQFLKLWIEEEVAKIKEIQSLGELTGEWEAIRQDTLHNQQAVLDVYTQNLRFITNIAESDNPAMTFKASSKKASKELEFLPLNLHLQRFWVSNEETKKSGCYDTVTVGAFTAYPHKYKSGGLKRLLLQQEGELASSSSHAQHHRGKSKTSRMVELMSNIVSLRKSVLFHCESVTRAALKREPEALNDAITDLTDNMRQLNLVCESPILEEAINSYFAAKPEVPAANPVFEPEAVSQRLSDDLSDYEPNSPEKDLKWNGCEFVLSPTVEPWDVTRVNAEAALVCTVSAVEELVTNKAETHLTFAWLEEMTPCIAKLKSCVDVMCRRAILGLTFMNLKDGGKNVMLKYQIKHRRDVVFSQAVTAITTGFITKLRSNMTNETFLQQLFQVGALVQFEGLLSCHADELGMLEDFIVGVDDMCSVSFRLVQSANSEEVMPSVSGHRGGYIIDIPVAHTIFQLLPVELQRGHHICIVPVLFNVGINETASYAERFGSMEVQEKLNIDSAWLLSQYCEKYIELLGEPDLNKGTAFSVLELVKLLNANVTAGKSKNVEICHLADEICRCLNGIRLCSCKSAKDRTAMAVTLEQCRILQQQHGLAPFAFNHALACMRSEGVRFQVTLKNTGTRKYAFNSVQLMSFPKMYRPPTGTFGTNET